MNHKISIPKYMELIFDSTYLVTAGILGICLLSDSSNTVQKLWGIMALVLAAGDAFHLVPRMLAVFTQDTKRFITAMGIGKLITSITMAVFYLLLWHCGLLLFSLTLPVQTIVLYVLIGARVILCVLPQNHWKQGGTGGLFAIYRNIPFVLLGLLVMWLYARYGAGSNVLPFVWLAILISFLCYLPVVLWVDKNPKFGMLMLPKTCAYLWILGMGFFI